MLVPFKPMSNLERQHRFCARHPGYYNKYSARRKARGIACKAQLKAIFAEAAAAEAKKAEAEKALAARSILMLPAPAEAIVLPGINTIPATPICAPSGMASLKE